MSTENTVSTESDHEYETESESESEESDSPYFKWADHELKPVKPIKEFHRRFLLGSVLGSGGDGIVYCDRLKSWPAIKKVDLHQFEDYEYEIKRSQQEQRLLAKASIANIYGIYHDEKENVLYKIYDRYDFALDDIINALELGMTETQTKYCIYNICCDIKKLHNQQFIHCDIKPSNILYTKQGTFKMKHRDKQTFKLIDYDGALWNNTNDVICTHWQGTLPFCAPEMNDYAGEMNIVGYPLDIWSIALLIVYCINGGDLGLMDINDEDHEQFYFECEDEEWDEAMEIKGAIFDEWYHDLFGKEMRYKREISIMYKTGKISRDLYDLLSGMLVKNPEERMPINEVLKHKWFQEIRAMNIAQQKVADIVIADEEHKHEVNLYEGIMGDDLKLRKQIVLAQINLLHEERNADTDSEDDEEEDEDDEKHEDTPEIRYYSDDEPITGTHRPLYLHAQYGATSITSVTDSEALKSPRNIAGRKGSISSS